MNKTVIKDFMRRIKMPEESVQTILDYEMSDTCYNKWKQLFYENSKLFFEELELVKNKEELTLYLYIKFAIIAKEAFVKKGIEETIYYDTMMDLSVWSRDCMMKKGIIGLSEAKWLRLHICANIYQLGRLQFEPDGEVIHVHVPEGTSLLPSLCDESFKKADQFFNDSYKMYDCDSWLLSPELKNVCADHSNIIKFQDRFVIQRVTHPFLQAEERVFGEIREDKSQYPEETSLQKALKQYVIAGSEPGMGYGIIKRK